MNTQILMAKANSLKSKKNRKGFTLVELIVVLVIIAILAAILIPTMSGYISRARKTSAQSACKTAVTAYSSAITDLIGSKSTLSSEDSAAIETKAAEYGAKTVATGDGVYGYNITADGALTALKYVSGNYTCYYYNSGTDDAPEYTYLCDKTSKLTKVPDNAKKADSKNVGAAQKADEKSKG